MSVRSLPKDEMGDELERLVDQIRARGVGETLPRPDPCALAALAAHLRGEEPMDAAELAEHELQRRAVEEEMRAVERAGEQRDRLLWRPWPATSWTPSSRGFPGETFRVLKEREMKQYGEYRTGRLVPAAWDAPSPA